MNLGFNFYFFDTIVNKVYFYSEGQGAVISSSPSIVRIHKFIIPFGTGLIDRGFTTTTSLSPLSYQVTGEPGKRICKIEWKNAGFTGDYEENGTLNDFVNFQLWLYETSGLIEMHYGNISISDVNLILGATGPYIGLSPRYDSFEYSFNAESLWLIGSPNNPTMIKNGDISFLNGITIPNTAYGFSNNLTISTNDLALDNIGKIYPNPATDYLNIELPYEQGEKLNIKILNNTGKVVTQLSCELNNDVVTIPILELKNGFYELEVSSSHNVRYFKFVKI